VGLIAVGVAALVGALLIDRHERRLHRDRHHHGRAAAHRRLMREVERQR
jgi:hypothetical protein